MLGFFILVLTTGVVQADICDNGSFCSEGYCCGDYCCQGSDDSGLLPLYIALGLICVAGFIITIAIKCRRCCNMRQQDARFIIPVRGQESRYGSVNHSPIPEAHRRTAPQSPDTIFSRNNTSFGLPPAYRANSTSNIHDQHCRNMPAQHTVLGMIADVPTETNSQMPAPPSYEQAMSSSGNGPINTPAPSHNNSTPASNVGQGLSSYQPQGAPAPSYSQSTHAPNVGQGVSSYLPHIAPVPGCDHRTSAPNVGQGVSSYQIQAAQLTGSDHMVPDNAMQ